MSLTPEYEFSEKKNGVFVHVFLWNANQKVTQSSVDVVVTPWTLKVNCPPYLLQLDLHAEVDFTKQHKPRVFRDSQNRPAVEVELSKKTQKVVWGQLETSEEDGSAVLESRRKSSIEAYEAFQINAHAETHKVKKEEEKKALQAEWERADDKKAKVKQYKREKKAEVAKVIEDFQHEKDGNNASILAAVASAPVDPVANFLAQNATDKATPSPSARPQKVVLPPARATAQPIKITHTERPMKTPAREDQDDKIARIIEYKRRKKNPDATGYV
jgi:hypothetical protein